MTEDADEEPAPLAVLADMLLGRAGEASVKLGVHEVRVSSALVATGVVLGLAAFGVVATAQLRGGPPQGLRELGGVLGGAALVALLWGILAGLPAPRVMRGVALAGVAVAAVGIAAFSWAYPERWAKPGVPDMMVPVLGTYVLGLVLLVAATAGALVANFVERMQARERLRKELGREPTDEEIRADIELAMRRYPVTWGGIAADKGRGIQVHVEDIPPEWRAALPKMGKRTEAPQELTAVDQAVDRLRDFRGGRMRRERQPVGGVGDAAAALNALRAAQHQQATAPKPTLVDRLLGRKPKAVALPKALAPWATGGTRIPRGPSLPPTNGSKPLNGHGAERRKPPGPPAPPESR